MCVMRKVGLLWYIIYVVLEPCVGGTVAGQGHHHSRSIVYYFCGRARLTIIVSCVWGTAQHGTAHHTTDSATRYE